MKEIIKNNTCGTGGCGCSEDVTAVIEDKFVAKKAAERQINIEFLYLDLNVCEQCKGSESNLDEALSEVSAVLESTGATVNLKKIHVESFEQAQQLNFISSPTIRINERDVQIEVKENYCSSCSELSGNETFCRVWNFGGEEFSVAPKFMVVEAILKEIYGGNTGTDARQASPKQVEQSLNNLKRFFEGHKTDADASDLKAAIVETAKQQETKTQTACSSGCGCS